MKKLSIEVAIILCAVFSTSVIVQLSLLPATTTHHVWGHFTLIPAVISAVLCLVWFYKVAKR
ncbi:hypothetical protein J1N51_02455 [Psychrosphaera ytuae]|uniref:Uncharacterized protein n=1 Tax=Psychrosphaera ytuae TaxID=2820710 RepID=A0A975DCF1_9GAMM|nr:hypothetical protein [Psychrosphaera ytuae]QTH64368.1 hypothetical protein J1N51_02455 [Psychrosphaera ytuae]